ncbi:MAG: glycosyltransferase [Planctomycetes bacterium]|nr:glycosyltransferase [Planctomycetota bacterium]
MAGAMTEERPDRLRVLFLASYFPKPDNPLMGPWALRQAQALVRAGVDVQVISLTSWVPRVAAVTRGARAFALCPPRHRWGSVEAVYPRWLLYQVQPLKRWAHARPQRQLQLGWVSSRRALLAAVDEGRPDLLYCHHTLPNGYLAARLREERGLPFVVTDHDFDEVDDCARLPARRAAYRFVLGRAARVVGVSSRMVTSLEALFPSARALTIHNGVDPPPAVAPPRPEDRSGRLVVFSCGLFYERKGFELLIAAFGRVAAERPNAVLRIVGDGPRRAEIEGSIRRLGLECRVTLLGRRPHDEVLREMAWSDVFALVGWDEPFATVYLEAMAAGRPVVCASDGGITDVLVDGVHGLTVPPRDIEATARALSRLLADGALRARLGAAARGLVDRRLTWDQVARRYAELFREVVAGGGG